MKTYAYYITATYEDCAENGAPVMVVDGFTGEIHATANHEDPWITEEWSLMVLGWLMKTTWEAEG